MHQHVTEKLVPVTDDIPAILYIASLTKSSVEVTPKEADMLRSYIEYKCETFYGLSFDRFVARWSMSGKPFAAIAGHNTVTFLKRSATDWAYRRVSWRNGPWFFPQPATGDGKPLTLSALLDRIETFAGEPTEKWTRWKAEHPRVFGVTV